MKKNILCTLLLALILISALFFPYDIHIQDVLLDVPAEEFDISISPLRILLEPIVGPMLFFLRADQPMEEMAAVLIWMLFLLLPIMLSKQIKQNGFSGKTLLKGLLYWASRAPLVIITWIAVLLIIIFVPLPSNTIINNDPDAVLVNTHSHSEWSHDGLISQQGQVRWHDRNGFDAFFITDHNTHTNTLEFVKEQKDGGLPTRPIVLCGEEFSGSNHITLLGLQRDFKTRGNVDSVVIDSTHANGGVAIVAHWFADEKKSIQHYIDAGADGFEIVNQAEGLQYDRRIFRDIVEHCRRDSLLMTGVCDYHGYGSAALAWNAFSIPGNEKMSRPELQQAIMEILRNHQQDKISVLMYRDRPLFPRDNVFWSPALNLVNYFRILDKWQVISWFAWFFIASIFCGFVAQKIKTTLKSNLIGTALGLSASVFVFLKALHLLSKAPAVQGYNEIYSEMGTQFSIIGIGFMLYSLIFIFFQQRYNRKIDKKNNLTY
jgi:hypothetical protein